MSHPRSTAKRIFHYIYNTVYFVLCLICAVLILVTPGDAIRQTYFDTLQYTNIIIIAIAYLVTVLIVLFIYSLRLYVTRTVLASIPKSWVPISKGDGMKKTVRDMVAKDLGRSAAIAWAARPKVMEREHTERGRSSALEDVPEEGTNRISFQEPVDEGKSARTSANWLRRKKSTTVENEMGISLPRTKPVWGKIEHPGWGSPDSVDLANIQYSAVMAELPNLIEAKVMSLAPPSPDAPRDTGLLDSEAVAVLQRVGNMGMRAYVSRLVDLGVLESSKDVARFLDVYEEARFSTKAIPVVMFRRLMHLFAELLRSAQPLDPAVLKTMRDMDDMYSESNRASGSEERGPRRGGSHHPDIDDDAPQNTSPTTPAQSVRTYDSGRSPGASGSPSSRLALKGLGMAGWNSSGNAYRHYGTAPTTPKSKAGRSSRNQRLENTASNCSIKSGSSGNSFAQTRRPYVASSNSQKSSLRSGSQGSGLSGVSGGSVIRLAGHDDDGDLPYVLRVSDTF